jgi:hypothetical protein
MVLIITFVYLIVPGILLGIGIGMSSSAAMKSSQGQSAIGLGLFGVFFAIVGGILYLIAAFILPMVLAHYAKNNEDFGAIFRFGEIISNVFKVISDYLIAIVVVIGVGILIAIVGMIPILGWIIMIALYFFLWLVFYTLFGMACSGAYQ